MKVDHYENFPVASLLLPKHLRAAVGVVYHFARSADDLADEGVAPPEARHAALDAYRAQLDLIAGSFEATAGTSVGIPVGITAFTPPVTSSSTPAAARIDPALPTLTPLFVALKRVIAAHRLPLQPFYDLLDAFGQDVDVKRYADFAAVRDYCRRSADPVGRIMLHLFDAATPENIRDSDDICSALQLINFWQDAAVDWSNGRVYLPADAMAAAGVGEAHLAEQRCDAAWRELMAAEVGRARQMMLRGAGLACRMRGRFGFELRLVVQGGLRILEKIERVDYDVFRRRPVIGRADAPVLLWRALMMR